MNIKELEQSLRGNGFWAIAAQWAMTRDIKKDAQFAQSMVQIIHEVTCQRPVTDIVDELIVAIAESNGLEFCSPEQLIVLAAACNVEMGDRAVAGDLRALQNRKVRRKTTIIVDLSGEARVDHMGG